MPHTTPTHDIWTGCYPSNWKGLILPQAMTHPAKFSSRLIRRIYEHLKEEGWLRIGDTVIDPFGGVALGALEAMRHGFHWVGVELEPKFVDLGSQNIAAWNKRFHTMPQWGSAILLQGDSRHICDLLKNKSTPYSPNVVGRGRNSELENVRMENKGYNPKGGAGMTNGVLMGEAYGSTPGQLGAMHPGSFDAAISSPTYMKTQVEKNSTGIDLSKQYEVYKGSGGGQTFEAFVATQQLHSQGYGDSMGQLANLPAGDFDSAISSPPFRQSTGGVNDALGDPALMQRHAAGNSAAEGYGCMEGNLANMNDKDFQVAISSPPYQNATEGTPLDPSKYPTLRGVLKQNAAKLQKYGDEAGNIGSDSGETFWLAARQIVEQVYLSLAPNAHAVWVVKDYVKNKQRVPFSDQWRQLCEAVGFVALHEHHAMLVHHKGKSHTLEGGIVEHITESKSFFRRLAEKKGSPHIDYETVFCMVKE